MSTKSKATPTPTAPAPAAAPGARQRITLGEAFVRILTKMGEESNAERHNAPADSEAALGPERNDYGVHQRYFVSPSMGGTIADCIFRAIAQGSVAGFAGTFVSVPNPYAPGKYVQAAVLESGGPPMSYVDIVRACSDQKLVVQIPTKKGRGWRLYLPGNVPVKVPGGTSKAAPDPTALNKVLFGA